MSEKAATSLFQTLNNRLRTDLMRDLIEHNEKDADARDGLLHCVRCYDICTDNRNILMHSIVEWVEGNEGAPESYDLAAFTKQKAKKSTEKTYSRFRLPR